VHLVGFYYTKSNIV